MMRDHYPKLAASAGDARLEAEVEDFLGRVFEFSELLVDKLGVTDVGASFPHTVTLHTSCHSLRSLHLTDQPARLLAAVRGLHFVALPHNDECCGFGGTFAVKNADVSTAMGNDKVANIAATNADVCVAGDNSCLMQIDGLLRRRGAPVRCMHLAEILASVDFRQPSPSTGSERSPADDSRRRCGARPGFPDRGEGARSPTRSCGATSATPPTSSAASARWSSAKYPTGSSCAKPDGRSRPTSSAISTPTCSSSKRTARAPAGTCTGPPTRTKPTASSST